MSSELKWKRKRREGGTELRAMYGNVRLLVHNRAAEPSSWFYKASAGYCNGTTETAPCRDQQHGMELAEQAAKRIYEQHSTTIRAAEARRAQYLERRKRANTDRGADGPGDEG